VVMEAGEKDLKIPKLFDLLEVDNIDEKIALLYLSMFYLALEPTNAEKVIHTQHTQHTHMVHTISSIRQYYESLSQY